MKMEDGLAGACTHVHDHTVIVETRSCCRLGDEVEHALGLVRRKLADLTKRVNVTLGDDEEVRGSTRRDVPDCDHTGRRGDMVAIREKRAEETVNMPSPIHDEALGRP
jgi:hypothetical protein